MLEPFDAHAALFRSWRVIRYEREGSAYLLHISALLRDNSRLDLRDYVFADGSRKYAYHWMEPDGALRRRWDNAPHWPDLATAPHHVHITDQGKPESSVITNIHDLLEFLQTWMDKQAK
jgi:hypothetical protein